MGELDINRLRKLCGMFGSAHDGEIANAARMADRLVREAGLDWGDVLGGGLPPPAEASLNGFWRSQQAAHGGWATAPADEPYSHWQVMARHCAVRHPRLSARELDFITGLMRRTREPTERQLAWLTAIYDRVTA